jgi:GTP:adenosylcobinamide-phosphate guanylyltransferase
LPAVAEFRSSFFTALVLAGRRGPTADPLAQPTGGSHKALIPVAGVPMLLRVIRSLQAVPCITKIVVSLDTPSVLRNVADIASLVDSGLVSFHKSARSPAESVFDYVEQRPTREPLLVTTADHPLLTAEMVSYFCAAAESSAADVSVGVVAASLFRAHYPYSKRTFISVRNESFCGTNLFALHSIQAAAAVRFWAHAGQFRKRPWRLVRAFGLATFVLFALRCLDLNTAIDRVSRVLGARIAIVQMPFAECAIDVDNADDLALASRILAEREGRSRSAAASCL